MGNFYGSNLGFLNHEALTIGNITNKDLKVEPELMATKWFDYRRLHPMLATMYFIQCYNEAYRAFCRKAIDAERAPFMKGINERDWLGSREKMTIWRLRQAVDRIGARYEFFWTFVMGYHYRLMGNGRIYAPRPNHIIKNEELFAALIEAWQEQCAISLQIARDPYYRVSNFNGSELRRAHEQFVIDQIKRRRLPHHALHAAIYLHDVVRIEEAIRQFEERVVSEAILA